MHNWGIDGYLMGKSVHFVRHFLDKFIFFVSRLTKTRGFIRQAEVRGSDRLVMGQPHPTGWL